MSVVPPAFVPCTEESWRAPWPMYRALRDHDPVHRVRHDDPAEDYWVLSRYTHVYDAVRDHETFSSANGLTIRYDELEAAGLADNPPMVMQDPPQHTAFRRSVSRGFTPRQVADVEPEVRRFVVERIERLRAEGGGDIVTQLFKPLPTMVVAHYLGVPESDRDRFDVWTDLVVEASANGNPLHAQQAIAEMMVYFTELIDRRRREPADDTISHLLAAGTGVAADDYAGIIEILGFAFTMVAGGNDTTTGLLGGAIQMLARQPEQRALLTADPSRIPAAVEEFARLTSPVQGLCRTTTRDVDLDGTVIPAGRKTLLLYGSANRDDREFGPDADELNVLRDPKQILTFAHGAHHCLGAAAARLQARVALTELLSRCPDFDVDIDAVRYAPGYYVRRPTTVPFML
nr:cytochrome P450 [Nocardia stercoris]